MLDNESQLNIPVVFFIFNRPLETKVSFAKIAAIKPKQLFIVSDGPRPERNGELQLVLETRAIATNVDWNCIVKTEFSSVNLGCKMRIVSGLNWVFQYVESAIILEDDCVPCEAFFWYCDALLKKYRNDKRVYTISGSNFSQPDDQHGHYFSRYALMWGWATWRDRWEKYQANPVDYCEITIKIWWRHPLILAYWLFVFESESTAQLDTWDVQWILTLWRENGFACRPTQNLVDNIGFGENATHTKEVSNNPIQKKTLDHKFKFDQCVGLAMPDRSRDIDDEKIWAKISWKSVLIMFINWLKK
jgi:hypothetical protein